MTSQEELNPNMDVDTGFYDDPVEVNNDFDDPIQEDTPWLNQPVDNLRLFDMGDFSNEGMKTYQGRKNWNVMVWSKGKSIEMIPADILNMRLGWDESRSWSWTQIYDDFWFALNNASDNISAIENTWNIITIQRDGIYKVSYNFWVNFVSHITWYILWIACSDGQTLFHKEYASNTGIQINVSGSISWSCSDWWSVSGSCTASWTIYLDDLRMTRQFNWGYRESFMELKKWDTLEFVMLAEYEATFS